MPARRLLCSLVVLSAVAAALVWIGITRGPDSELRLEAGKAGLNLILLVLVAVGVTGVLESRAAARENRRRGDAEAREVQRRRDAESREERRQNSDYAVKIQREIINNYNRLKAARRALRAAGLAAPAEGVLSAHQVQEFEREMKSLGAVQLAFEAITRELDTRIPDDEDGEATAAAASSPDDPLRSPKASLRKLSSYAKGVVKEWEACGSHVAVGDDVSVIASRAKLQSFITASSLDGKKEFRRNASEPLLDLQKFFHARVFVPMLSEDDPGVEERPMGPR